MTRPSNDISRPIESITRVEQVANVPLPEARVWQGASYDERREQEHTADLRQLRRLDKQHAKASTKLAKVRHQLGELADSEAAYRREEAAQRREAEREAKRGPAKQGAPWNPWRCVSWAWMFGLPVSGALLAMNFKRLGRPQLRLPILLVTSVGSLALLVVLTKLNVPGRRYVYRGASFVLSIPLWAAQRQGFKEYMAGDRRPANTILPALATAAVAYGLILGGAALLDYVR